MWAAPPASAAALCPTDRQDLLVEVKQVHDGDTVQLVDGERVRLVGINAPELGRDGQPDEPLSQASRQALTALLRESGMRLGLRFDAERRDRYGRLLAHVFLADGRNAAAQLLQRGLALALTVPPNDWGWRCYRGAESDARHRRVGLWSGSTTPLLQARDTGNSERGYRIVAGQVSRIEHLPQGVRLTLDDRVVAWIPIEHASRFGDLGPTWHGRAIEVRGWLRRRRGRVELVLSHPAAVAWPIPSR